MADAAADMLSNIGSFQAALTTLTALQLTSFRYPSACTVTNGSSYDYIVVGCGTAGSVLAYRLSTNSNVKVLCIEAGPPAPFEADIPLTFTLLPKSVYDWDIPSVNDGYTAQNLQDSCVSLTAGKMLGGSGALDHLIHVQGDPYDYNNWAKILNDDRWNYENCLTSFKKIENLNDPDLDTSLHGTDGMLKIRREPSPVNDFYFQAFAELNHKIVNDTTSRTSSLGYVSPLFTTGNDIRQSSGNAYLGAARSRKNLCVAVSTIATKILIEKGTAVGVQVETSSGETFVVYAKKEVIVSAGTIGSPKLLMLSGIGPKAHLEKRGIPVVADLPVGENFMDHPSAVLVYQMEENNDPAEPSNPYVFPVPTHIGYAALDPAQTYPDYQVINLVFPHDSPAQLQLCSNVFKYSNKICNDFYAASQGRTTLMVVHNLMLPNSRGKIELAEDPTSNPLVYTGTFSDASDLDLMARSLEDFNKVLYTKQFTSVNATMVNPGVCPGLSGIEFWKCYALSMSATMWHYVGTCSMGKVVDSELRVIGVGNLRVADGSVMPTHVCGNIRAPIAMIAEHCYKFIDQAEKLACY